jgi:hypothetical protein
MQKTSSEFWQQVKQDRFRGPPGAGINVEVTTYKSPGAMRKKFPGYKTFEQALTNLCAETA